MIIVLSLTPYSLGKLIDWKLRVNPVFFHLVFALWTPYSLGKLIDWKQMDLNMVFLLIRTPYSLGKLIDWKLSPLPLPLLTDSKALPTR